MGKAETIERSPGGVLRLDEHGPLLSDRNAALDVVGQTWGGEIDRVVVP